MEQSTPDQASTEARDPAGAAAPGWYPDPGDPSSLRWWDGAAWADPNAPGSNKALDAGAHVNPASISNPDATRYAEILQPDPNEAVDTGDMARSTRIIMIIGAVVVGVFLLTVGAILLSRGGSETGETTLSAATVADTLEAAGLAIGDVEVYTESTDPDGLLGRPGLYVARADFEDTTLDPASEPPEQADAGTLAGGSIEVYASEADAQKRIEVISSGANTNNIQAGTVVIRLSPAMSRANVLDYERALEAEYADTTTNGD